MGALLERRAAEKGHEVIAALGRNNLDELASLPAADMAVDFSRPETLDAVCAYVRRTGTPLVNGTTGYSREQQEALRVLGDHAPVLHAVNFALGVAVLQQVLKQISDVLKPTFDIEIEEIHHGDKDDAPSGTAKMLLAAIDPAGEYKPVYGREGYTGPRTQKEIGIHALRGGTVPGVNGVHFLGVDEELTLTHRAGSRVIFVDGAIRAAELLAGKPKGFYALEDLLFGQ